MASDWWRRLPATQRREYERSAAIARLDVAPGRDLATAVEAIQRALGRDDRSATQAAAQHLVNLLCSRLGLTAVEVEVSGVRPHDRRGELHGLYTPGAGAQGDHIKVWMRTAQRRDVVAIRTFLRTLLHEVCHHVDFLRLALPHSFHTPGFYQRESSLFRAVTRGTPLAGRAVGRTHGARPLAAAGASAARAAAPAPVPAGRPNGIELLRAAAAAIVARQKARRDEPGG